MFSSDFWYNKNFSPEAPGIVNFSVWFVKTSFIVALILISISLTIPDAGQSTLANIITVILPFFEEHGRIVFSVNSKNRYAYCFKFGILLFLFEAISQGMNGNDISFYQLASAIESRLPSILTHASLSLLMFTFYKIQESGRLKSLYTIWILASSTHLLLNLSIDYFYDGSFFI